MTAEPTGPVAAPEWPAACQVLGFWDYQIVRRRHVSSPGEAWRTAQDWMMHGFVVGFTGALLLELRASHDESV